MAAELSRRTATTQARITSMRTLMAVSALALGLFGAAAAPAQAERAWLAPNDKIIIDYVEPRHPIYAYGLSPDDPEQQADYKKLDAQFQRYSLIYERMRRLNLLEEFSVFLAPLRLPIPLRLKTEQCGQANAFYNPTESSITLCYEYIAQIEDRAPTTTTREGVTRRDAIVGQIVGTMLHEAGHAVSNLLQLPVLGREEDTADQIAAFVMLQFGGDVARTLIKGEAYGWNQSERRSLPMYWDVHSTALQRQHTYLCLAYGRDPQTFEDFINFGWLPRSRADNCAQEYKQVEQAFRLTVLPHVDRDLMKRVQNRPWLPGPN
ncbi:MAG: DUF4344 domain-containing metallopeptidase [Xanthobacteraceae bacterium]